MTFSDEGKVRWEQLYNAHVAEMNAEDFPPSLRGTWGKFREYAGRLVLILTLMHYAADQDADAKLVPQVSRERVEGAWCLVDYFKSHARRIHTVIADGPNTRRGRVVHALIKWVQSGHRPSFTEHEFKQSRRWVKDEDLCDALNYLAGRNAIRPRNAPADAPKAGRPPSPSYDVNPEMFNGENITRNPRNTQNSDQEEPADFDFEGIEDFEKQVGGDTF
jgi:hypothetical protein